MTGKFMKCLWGIISTILLALYVFMFYELLLIPAVLDWSSFGVLLALGLVGLLIWCIPTDKRKPTTVLAIIFLLSIRALFNIKDYPVLKLVFSTIFIFLVLFMVGKLLGRFTFRRYLLVFIVAVIINISIDLSQVRFWTEFEVKWESPVLYKRYGSVDYFPITLADVDGDGASEIITQQNLKMVEKEKLEIAENGKQYQILKPESNYFVVYKWVDGDFVELMPDQYSMDKLVAALPNDYLGYPFYKTSMQLKEPHGIEQQMEPLLDRTELIEEATRFGSFPFKMLDLNQVSLDTRVKSMARLGKPEHSIVGSGNIVAGAEREIVTLGESLNIWETDPLDNRLIGSIGVETIPDIGTSEVLVGDADGDGIDEILLTSEVSRILKLTADGKWKILWASPEELGDKARFQKFRFEDFAPLGDSPEPQIIALSKSNVRENPTRYMTGYTYKDGALHQNWRVFSGLINLRAADIDGDGKNELAGYMYRAQRIFILSKHGLPVVHTLYLLTGALIITGFSLQWRQKKQQNNGGEKNA